MPSLNRTHVAEIRGIGRMLTDASAGVVDIVERMHRTIQDRPGPFGAPVHAMTRGLTGQIYRGVRGGMKLVGRGLDLSIGSVEALLPEGAPTPKREVLASVLNGVYGDYLARTANPLAITMQFRRGGAAVDPAEFAKLGRTGSGKKLLVFVHGLCMSDQQWLRDGRGHATALAEELDCETLYLRYNSGLRIAANGRQFAGLLEQLLGACSVRPEELVIVGHSLGGLVARSACLFAAEQRHAWLGSLTRMIFIGTPHCGAPLERTGHGLDYLMDLTPYSAPFTRLGKARSAGIKDLRLGTITTDGHRFVPLPGQVSCYAMGATLGARRSPLADRLVGDGLVPLRSALGQGPDKSRSLRFPREQQWIGYEMGHLELLHRPEVYAQLRTWLSTAAARP